MLYPVLASVMVWSAILFGLRATLSRRRPPVWAHRTITATVVTIVVLSVFAIGLYSGLSRLLGETSILWTLS
jgi:hypothetical protein